MRLVGLCLALLLAACASPPSGRRADSIEVVYVPDSMYYTIEDGGRARLVGADNERVFEFDSSREDFRRIAELLAPLQAEGYICATPPDPPSQGYISWRRGGEEVRRVPLHSLCYDAPLAHQRSNNEAWRVMGDMGRARYVAPQIPAPTIITLQNMYWGNPTSSWTIPRDGEGRYVDEHSTVTFAVSEETFDRIRELFRPYEGTHFECRRVISDGPYGFVIWSSREGQEDQRTLWDAGCVSGDANDLFARLDAAGEILVPLRDAAAPAP